MNFHSICSNSKTKGLLKFERKALQGGGRGGWDRQKDDTLAATQDPEIGA